MLAAIIMAHCTFSQTLDFHNGIIHFTYTLGLSPDSTERSTTFQVSNMVPRPRVKRADASSSHLINDLISAANTSDRFKLLEDDSVLPANLTNSVHPLFRQLEGEKQLHLALRLASQFLLHDRLLEFFVPLLYGRVMHDLKSSKEYLCDPLVHASKTRRASLLTSVRQALECLADRVEISFVSQKQRVWARTIVDDSVSTAKSCCCRAYQTQITPKIEVTEKFLQFYQAPDGYAKASCSAQFRHDFLFATTLVHEVVHAVGVMRRGDLTEPHYRLDYPETEWGYAWETFMFGSIINPQDKTTAGTHILMRKIWADDGAANANGGKEYSDVPMSWIAQWFRTETWSTVKKEGPIAIKPPTTHFKIQVSHKHGAWIVWSDCSDVRADIAALYTQWQMHSLGLRSVNCASNSGNISSLVYYNKVTTTELQIPNVPVPQRERDTPKPSTIRRLLSSKKQRAAKTSPSAKQCASVDNTLINDDSPRGMRDRGSADNHDYLRSPVSAIDFTPINTSLIAVCRAASPCTTQRKRPANDSDDDYLPPNRKRERTKLEV